MGKPTEGEKQEYKKKVKLEVPGDKWEEALKRAWDTRRFEIELSWKRTNYFSIMVGALFIGYYTLKDEPLLAILISLLGFCASLAWFFVNKGSKFWQENWEINIDCIEAITKDNMLHSNVFSYHYNHRPLHPTRAYPFSVSKINMVFSGFVTIAWFIIYVYSIWNSSQFCFLMKLALSDIAVIVLIISSLIISHYGNSSFAGKEKTLADDNPCPKKEVYYYQDSECKETDCSNKNNKEHETNIFIKIIIFLLIVLLVLVLFIP